MEIIKWLSILGLLPFLFCIMLLIFFYIIMPLFKIQDDGSYMGPHIAMFVAGGISIISLFIYIGIYQLFGMDVVYYVAAAFGTIMSATFLYYRYIEE